MELAKPVKRAKTKPKPLKRSRPRRKRKGGPAALAREADRLWSLLVRAQGKCEGCSKTDRLQGAHGFSRRYRATRWLPINGFCLCSGCHVYFTHRPLEWDDFLRIWWGEPVYDELKAKAIKGDKPDLEAIVESLRCELQRSTNGGK